MKIKKGGDIAISLVGLNNWLLLDNKYDLNKAKEKWVAVEEEIIFLKDVVKLMGDIDTLTPRCVQVRIFLKGRIKELEGKDE